MQTFVKNSLAVLLCLFLVQAAQAQAAFGVKAGVHISNPNISFDNSDIETSGVTNLQLGLLLDLPVGSILSLQPEFNYIAKGYKSERFTVGGIEIFRNGKVNLGYVDLGGLFKFNFGQNSGIGGYAGFGPFFSYAVSGREEFDGNDRDIDWDETQLKRTDFSVAGALGLTFGSDFRFFVDARYLAGLANNSERDEVEFRNKGIGITGGVMVPLGQ